MKRWLGIILSVVLVVGTLQVPVYAAETGETAVEAVVEEESIRSEDVLESKEPEEESVVENSAELMGDMDAEDEDMEDEPEKASLEDTETDEDVQKQPEENDEEPLDNVPYTGKSEDGIIEDDTDETDYSEAKMEIVASGTCRDNLTWTLDGEGTLTISGSGEMNFYSYGKPWEDYSASIKTVIIEKGVKSIGENAFYNYSNLANISIPDTVKHIDSFAFYKCDSLKNISIPDGVSRLKWNTFGYCHNLTDITIPNSVTVIESGVFEGCTSLTNITIPDSVTSIGSNSFRYCVKLKSITIPNNVTCIEKELFYSCESLTNVLIPDSTTSIGENAFYGCSSLTSISIPKRMTSIGKNAFAGCRGFISIAIPDNITSIEENAFYNCSNLTSIEIPNSVTSIGGNAFSNCSSLTGITIPNSVTSIGADAFYNCNSLTSATISQNLICIEYELFKNCKSLVSIVIPDGVEIIGQSAFSGCTSLMSIKIPESVTSIGAFAFYDCNKLTSITIPDNIKNIEYCVFGRCSSLTNLKIPDKVTSIDSNAFQGCTSLNSIIIPEGVTSIENYTFSSCQGLENITIPDSVMSIGENAFNNCYSLTHIRIPSGVTSIKHDTFYCCYSLTNVIIPASITEIGEKAFYGCSKLADVYYTGTEEDWNSITFKGSNSFLTDSTIHYGYESDETVLSLEPLYEGKVEKTIVIEAEIISKKAKPDSTNTSWLISGLDSQKYEWGTSITVSFEGNNKYKAVRSIEIKEEGTYSITVSVNGASDSATAIVDPQVDVKFTKFELGLNRELTVYWEKENNEIELLEYEIEYEKKISPTKYTKGVTGSNTFVNITNIESDGEYQFRIRGKKKDSTYTAWSSVSICPVYQIKLLASPKDCMDLVNMPIQIDFGHTIQLTEKGKAKLLSGSNSTVQEAPLSLNGEGIEYKVNTVGSLLIFSLNKSYEQNPIKPDTRYSIEIEDGAIEFTKDDEGYKTPVYFKGIGKNKWTITTSPVTYVKSHNPIDKTIPDAYYKEMYLPKEWKKIKSLDDGSPGWCFGLSYASIAYRRKYSNILKASNNLTLDNCSLDNSSLSEYIQKAHLYQYYPHCQNTITENVGNYAGLYDEITSGIDVIIGVEGEAGGHAIFPIKITKDDSSKVEIAVYDSNGNPLKDLVEQGYTGVGSSFIQILTLYRDSSGKFTGYHYPGFDKRLFYQIVGVEIDAKTKIDNKEYMISSSKPIDGMEEIVVLNGKNDDSEEYLYWYDSSSFTYYGSNKNTANSIWFSDGFTSVEYNSNTDKSVVFDMASANIVSIEPSNTGEEKEDQYTITVSTAADYDNETTIEIKGTGSDKVSLVKNEDNLIISNPGQNLLNISKFENSELKDSGYIKSEGDDIRISVSGNEISASIDEDNDGVYETSLDTIRRLVEEIKLNEDSVEIPLGAQKSLIATVYPENADMKKVVWTSSNPDIITVDNEGTVTTVSDGTAIVTATAVDGSEVFATCTINVSGASISNAIITGIVAKTYTGQTCMQTPVIKVGDIVLRKDVDYTVTYLNNTDVGTATITITGIGSYTGTVTKTFLILPGKTTRGDMFNLANNVKVTWKEVPGAKYYKVYREGITDKKETRKDPVIVTAGLIGWDKETGLTNGHAYRYKIVASITEKGDSGGDSLLSYSKVMYRLKTVVIRSVKNTAPGKVTVKYDKTTSGDSYVLQYCEREDMVGAKTKVVLGANNTSYTIGGLKKGKTYYISIRVRKKVNGIDYYTTFGVPKKIKIEK